MRTNLFTERKPAGMEVGVSAHCVFHNTWRATTVRCVCDAFVILRNSRCYEYQSPD